MNSNINKKGKNGKQLLDNSSNYNITEIHLLGNLTKDSFSFFLLDNIFYVFNSINNIVYLIYSNKRQSIISFSLISNKKLTEIKNAHNKSISNFKYYFDKNNKREVLISISALDNNVKLWNVNNWECLLSIENINNSGSLFSVSLLKENEQNYIITSNFNSEGDSESIKLFDLDGNKIKEINDSNDDTYFIDVYYDIKIQKNYIITGNKNYVKSYDYKENKIYYIYNDNDNRSHNSLIIKDNEEIIKLIESSEDGNLRIWDFHSGNLLRKIYVNKNRLYSICLWNNEYLFVGCGDNKIKLLELNTGKIIKDLKGHKIYAIALKKISHPLYGECLI